MVLSRRFFATRGVLLVMKTLEDERYVVIKAYKCAVSEIWRDFFVLAYIACTSYPYIATESTDSVIRLQVEAIKRNKIPTSWYVMNPGNIVVTHFVSFFPSECSPAHGS